MILLVQKQTGHEPDIWEDVKIPDDCVDKSVEYLAIKFRILQAEGHHRVFTDDGKVHTFRAYPVTEWRVSVNGEVVEE